MAIFPNLILEKDIQVNDKTRLDASKSFVTQDEAAITLVEIEPEAAAGFIDVTPSPATKASDYFLDWQYSGATRTVTATVRITTDGAPVTFSDTIEVTTAADDMLLSNDKDLTAIEEDILKFVPKGRNSWLNVHRKAQQLILDEIDERGITNTDGTRITKDQLVEIEDFRQWSAYMTLWLIMNDISNSVDDKFANKAASYKNTMDFHRERSFMRIDFNKDGNIDAGEKEPVRSSRLIRV